MPCGIYRCAIQAYMNNCTCSQSTENQQLYLVGEQFPTVCISATVPISRIRDVARHQLQVLVSKSNRSSACTDFFFDRWCVFIVTPMRVCVCQLGFTFAGLFRSRAGVFIVWPTEWRRRRCRLNFPCPFAVIWATSCLFVFFCVKYALCMCKDFVR